MMNDELKPRRKARASRPGKFSIQNSTFSIPVRVYYEDTDAGGVVYYANYLKFLERARTEWLRALGFELDRLAREHGVIFIVRSLSIEYLKPAAFNDEIAATVELGELGGGQIILMQRITRGAEELATARVRLACVNPATFRPVRIPRNVAERLNCHVPYGKPGKRSG
jgi:acyl-CoA thioester hydrolase